MTVQFAKRQIKKATVYADNPTTHLIYYTGVTLVYMLRVSRQN